MSDRAFVAWQKLALGCAILEPGSTARLKTGDWKSLAPFLDEEKCVKCARCATYCPEFCYAEDRDGFFRADLSYCKGCGICAHECPTQAISMGKEKK